MADELFSREEALQGMVGRRASRLLLFIEMQTRQTVEQLRRTIDQFLNQKTIDYAPPDTFRPFRFADIAITGQDIERTAPTWASLIPENARLVAAAARLLLNKYPLDYESIPNLRAALRLDSEEVREAYADLYEGETPEEAASGSDREEGIPPEDVDPVVYDLECRLEWLTLSRGETLFRQGEQGNTLCILVSGLLRVIVEHPDGSQEIVDNLTRGETIGEMAIFTEKPRSSTVRAVRDCALVQFTREAFNEWIEHHPQVIMPITRSIVRRWRRQTMGIHDKITRPVVLTAVPAGPDVPLSEFVKRLTAELKKIGPTLHLDAAAVDERLESGMAQTPQMGEDNYRLAGWLSEQEALHQFVIYEADFSASEWTRRCLRQSDRVLIIASAKAEPAPGPIEKNLLSELFVEPIRRDLILLHENHIPIGLTQQWLNPRPELHRHYHVREGNAGDLARLSRFIAGRALGLVLSGGGARCIAEIGAVRAMREEGIIIDAVAGASAGALAGASLAMEWDDNRIFSISTSVGDCRL